MKVEAPEKIWINPSIDLPKLNGVLDRESVQYVRKDAFIEKACLWLSNVSTEDMEYLFPELAKSEDERIRNWLIGYFHQYKKDGMEKYANGLKVESIIAWLEKQGTPAKLSEEEQNKLAKVVLTSCAMSFIDYLEAHKYEGKMCVSNGECEDIENAFHNAMWDRLHRYYCKYIEKQGEQILAEGVEYYPDDDTLLMIRCPECGQENYAPAVATGRCVWCGFDGRILLNKLKSKDIKH